MSKIPESVDPFIFIDIDVTEARLDKFASAPRATQLKVLAFLRNRTVEENVELPVVAIVLAVVIPLAAILSPPNMQPGPWWATSIAVFIVGLAATAIIVAAFGLGPLIRHNQRQRAVVWLAAYESELERRFSLRGRAARAWQRAH